jgi:predicted metal-binding protein
MYGHANNSFVITALLLLAASPSLKGAEDTFTIGNIKVPDHAGFLFGNADEWQKAAEGWLPYLKHPQHVRWAANRS